MPASKRIFEKQAERLLTANLPTRYAEYFDIRRAGKYWGLSIICPTCGEAPPGSVVGGRRWRWLAVHIAKHKPVRLAR